MRLEDYGNGDFNFFYYKYKWTYFRPGIKKNTISYTGEKWNSTRT